MKSKVVGLVILFALCAILFAEKPDAPKPILKPGDVKHFIKTFPLLKKEFKKFQLKYDGKAGIITYPDALAASSEFMDILKKHGWDEHFFQKIAAIATGYSMIVAGEGIKNADPQIAKSIKEIESNPHLSDDMKKQLLEQIKNVKGTLQQQQNALKNTSHQEDMELIKPHMEELKKVFEEK
jgi:hypothetical protein